MILVSLLGGLKLVSDSRLSSVFYFGSVGLEILWRMAVFRNRNLLCLVWLCILMVLDPETLLFLLSFISRLLVFVAIIYVVLVLIFLRLRLCRWVNSLSDLKKIEILLKRVFIFLIILIRLLHSRCWNTLRRNLRCLINSFLIY